MKFIVAEKPFPWLKENLSLVVLLPTLLGGLWQMLELGAIGLPYIRFFSVAQLIPDGLLVLFMLGIIFIIFRGVFKVRGLPANKGNAAEVTTSREGDGIRNGRSSGALFTANMVMLAIAVVIFFYALFPIIKSVYVARKISFVQLVLLLGTFVVVAELLSISIKYFVSLAKLNINSENMIAKIIMGILELLGGVLFISLILLGLKLFHNSFLLPGDFKNLNAIECVLRNSNAKIRSLKLVYFNDKYLFMKIEEDLKASQIQVIKFEDILSKDPCN